MTITQNEIVRLMRNKIVCNELVRLMREFQETNNITSQCVTNCTYFSDHVKCNGIGNAKVKQVVAVGQDDNGNSKIVMGHLVVVLDDVEIIDPSNDVYSMKCLHYFDNAKDLMFYIQPANLPKDTIGGILQHIISFKKLAERINHGDFLICDRHHYLSQADFVESCFKKM